MHCRLSRNIVFLAAAAISMPLAAQRHSASPPTAPPRPAPPPVAVSSGMGNIQFQAVNYGVPAPQSLTRQLRFDDDRTRASALSAIGAPSQYLQRGHIGMPRSVQLEFADLGSDPELAALLTVELDQHIVTAVLIPDGDNWRRIATVLVADSFDDPRTTPSTFVHTARTFTEHTHYEAVFHAVQADTHGNYTENEAQLRVVNKHAVITTSFVSAQRDCNAPGPPDKKGKPTPGCNVLRRWLQPDSADPLHRFIMVSATGRLNPQDAASPIDYTHVFEAAHLRAFDCQPFVFSDATQHFDVSGASAACSQPK